MSEALSLRRRRQFSILKELPNLRSLDEFPLTDPEIDPQVHVSKADVDQPFFLICEKDTVLVQMTGEGRVVFGTARCWKRRPSRAPSSMFPPACRTGS